MLLGIVIYLIVFTIIGLLVGNPLLGVHIILWILMLGPLLLLLEWLGLV